MPKEHPNAKNPTRTLRKTIKKATTNEGAPRNALSSVENHARLSPTITKTLKDHERCPQRLKDSADEARKLAALGFKLQLRVHKELNQKQKETIQALENQNKQQRAVIQKLLNEVNHLEMHTVILRRLRDEDHRVFEVVMESCNRLLKRN